MPNPLYPTDITARISWLGQVTEQTGDIRSAAQDVIQATYAGQEGARHAGLTRAACVRVKEMHANGTEIRNVRQFSVVSAEELALIAADLGLEAIKPEWLGASIVVEGIEDFSHVPPSSRLQNNAGTALVIDMQNFPCGYPGREIEKDHPGQGRRFAKVAQGRRGVTAWVEREGPLRVGDALRLHVPSQRAWQPFGSVVKAAE
ncbi:MAG: MOSC domain-containing protein [Pseudomonadota bacterium]